MKAAVASRFALEPPLKEPRPGVSSTAWSQQDLPSDDCHSPWPLSPSTEAQGPLAYPPAPAFTLAGRQAVLHTHLSNLLNCKPDGATAVKGHAGVQAAAAAVARQAPVLCAQHHFIFPSPESLTQPLLSFLPSNREWYALPDTRTHTHVRVCSAPATASLSRCLHSFLG